MLKHNKARNQYEYLSKIFPLGLILIEEKRKEAVDAPEGRCGHAAGYGSLLCPLLMPCLYNRCLPQSRVNYVYFNLILHAWGKLVIFKVFWKLKQLLCKVFSLSLKFFKAKHTDISISNASGQILIIQKGIELKRNWAGRDIKQDLTCLCQILSKSETEISEFDLWEEPWLQGAEF